MFAPKVAKTQPKALASHTHKRVAERAPLVTYRLNREKDTKAQGPQRGVAWDAEKIPIHPPDRSRRSQPGSLSIAPPGVVQTKLAVAGANDPLEREADRVADQVIGMPDAQTSVTAGSPQLSRKCAACDEEEKAQALQTKPAGSSGQGAREVAPIVHEVLRSPGQPLDARTRAYFEPRFQHDFSRVRVHVGDRAAESAQTLNALAYTVGTDVVFASSRYTPGSTAGRRLLAHELAHVVQQSGSHKFPGGEAAEQQGGAIPAVTTDGARPRVQRQASDFGVDHAPVTGGRQRPRFAEAAAVSQAEKTRQSILDAAINQLGPVFDAMKRQRANEPTRAFDAPRPVADAMRSLGLNNTRIDTDTAEGMGTLAYLYSAFLSLVKNRYSSFADVQIGSSDECANPLLYGAETSAGSGTQEPIVLCPVFFGARDECRAFILMHEYFHKVGLIGHGERSLGSGADSVRDEMLRRGYKPGYLTASPSALATFAWLLATGKDPQCSEQSEVIQREPTSPAGPIA